MRINRWCYIASSLKASVKCQKGIHFKIWMLIQIQSWKTDCTRCFATHSACNYWILCCCHLSRFITDNNLFSCDSGYSNEHDYCANWIPLKIISTVASVQMECKKFQETNFLVVIGILCLLVQTRYLRKRTYELGRTNKIKHSIHTGNAQPIRQPVHKVPVCQRQEMQKLLVEMHKKDVIQPSQSPWTSPVVLVRKKDGSTQFCIDYRKLNSVTRKDAYLIPRIDDTLDTFAGSQWFSTLDMVSGYWQVEVGEADREKTAFCTSNGQYEFKVMPFGLCNGPATFQRWMDLVLAGLQMSHCLVYVDDVIVMGKSFEDHLHNLRRVFERVQEAGLTLKPTKCTFFQTKVFYLGYFVSREGISTDPVKIDKKARWPTPQSAKDVQQFLSLAGYYRRFVRDFSTITKPLHCLTEKTARFEWTTGCEEAFQILRQRLCSVPVLGFPNFDKPFKLDTDASNTGIGESFSIR